jgi:hypothetical protein
MDCTGCRYGCVPLAVGVAPPRILPSSERLVEDTLRRSTTHFLTCTNVQNSVILAIHAIRLAKLFEKLTTFTPTVWRFFGGRTDAACHELVEWCAPWVSRTDP